MVFDPEELLVVEDGELVFEGGVAVVVVIVLVSLFVTTIGLVWTTVWTTLADVAFEFDLLLSYLLLLNNEIKPVKTPRAGELTTDSNLLLFFKVVEVPVDKDVTLTSTILTESVL